MANANPRQFTDKDRQKSSDNRKANKAAQKVAATIAHVRSLYDGLDVADVVHLTQGYLFSVVMSETETTGNRIRAAAQLLPYVVPRLRARDLEMDGEEPININEQQIEALTKRHGDPWAKETEDGDDSGTNGSTAGRE